jgi:hypothetical protein
VGEAENPSAPLTTRPVRTQERALHYFAGLSYLDERLAAGAGPLEQAHELMASHQRLADTIYPYFSRLRRGIEKISRQLARCG